MGLGPRVDAGARGPLSPCGITGLVPGVVLSEAVSADNPLITFEYQTGGLLTDIFSLTLQVLDASGVQKLAATTINLNDPPVGSRLGIGRYAGVFTPTTGSGWATGTHTAIWRYRVVSGGVEKAVRRRFEVLDATNFVTGAEYVGYADTSELRANAQFSSLTVAQTQKLVDSASRKVETLTGRFFEPRYLTSAYSGKGAGSLLLGHPIIGLASAFEFASGLADALFEIDRTALLVYNRHLEGMFDPDDRNDPRVEYATDLIPGRIIWQGAFTDGSKNVQLNGLFGYTDYDGSPTGRTPKQLTQVIGYFAAHEQLDPFGLDVSVSAPGRVKAARTRDQAIEFASGAGAAAYQGAITGDRVVDDYLLTLLRPPAMFAV